MTAEELRFTPTVIHDGELLPDYSTAIVVDQVVFTVSDTVIGTLAFIIGIAHQSDLSRDPNYVGFVLLIFMAVLGTTTFLEYIRRSHSQNKMKRTHLVQLMMKIILIIGAYLLGLFGRIVSDLVVNMPRVGVLSLVSMFKPLVIIAIFFAFLYASQMLSGPRRDIIELLEQPIIVKL